MTLSEFEEPIGVPRCGVQWPSGNPESPHRCHVQVELGKAHEGPHRCCNRTPEQAAAELADREASSAKSMGWDFIIVV